MRILLTGGTGFIGKALSIELLKKGHRLTLVSRRKNPSSDFAYLPVEFALWDMEKNPAPPALDPEAFDAVLHLAGENIAGGLWTRARKRRLLESRTRTSQALETWLGKRSTLIPLVLLPIRVSFDPLVRGI